MKKTIKKVKSDIWNKLPLFIKNLLRFLFLKNRVAFFDYDMKYNQDGLATMHSADFIKDPEFESAYNLGKSTGSWDGYKIHWRIHIILNLGSIVKHKEGDYVECGVYKGGTSFALVNHLKFENLNRKFWLFDTFSGLSEEHVSVKEKENNIVERFREMYEDNYYEEVKTTFEGYKNVEVVRGPVPDTLSMFSGDKVCYLAIDMNSVFPEIAAIEFFWDKIVSGGVVILDDYGWKYHEEQKEAFDKFIDKTNSNIMYLPTGQGIIIKS
jgi:O-methyltransferase